MKLLLSVLFVAAGMFAQEPAAPAKPPRQPPTPKNLKILPPENLMRVMQAFKAALGVECTECHVKGDFASDENPKKETARQMLAMTKEINSKFPDGKMHVNCYTCHRGSAEPLMAPKPAEKTGG